MMILQVTSLSSHYSLPPLSSLLSCPLSFLPCLLSIPPSSFTLPLFSVLLLSTELENYRLIEVRRNLWSSSCSTPLLKRGHLGPVGQDHVYTAFKCLQEWRLHSLCGQAVSVFCHPHSEECLLVCKRNLLCFSVCSFRLGHQGKVWLRLLFIFPSDIRKL